MDSKYQDGQKTQSQLPLSVLNAPRGEGTLRESFVPMRRSMQKIITITALVVGLSISTAQIIIDYIERRGDVTAEVHRNEESVKPLLAQAIWNFDGALMGLLGDQLLLSESVARVDVLDIYGRVLISRINSKVSPSDIGSPIKSSLNMHAKKNQNIGELVIYPSYAAVRENIFRNIIRVVLFTSFYVAFLAWTMGQALQRIVVHPLDKLARAIRQMPDNPTESKDHAPILDEMMDHEKPNEIDVVAAFIDKREKRLRALITDLREREEHLLEIGEHQRKLTERLEFILKANRLGAWEIVVASGDATYNERWLEMQQLTTRQVINHFGYWKSRIHVEDLPSFEERFEDHIRGGSSSIHNVHRIRREDHSYMWVLCTGMSVAFDHKGQATKVVGTILDISDLMRAKESALAASKAKSEFLANMSHEIRTPLNGVLGMTSLLKRTTLDAMQSEFIKTIDISGKQLLSVISDILDLSKVESGKFELSPVNVSVRSIVENTMRIVASTASQKGISVQTSVDPHVPESILCDDTRLQQVLVNLASNAVKFTTEGNVQITVVARASAKFSGWFELEFHVIDEGIGIPPDQLKKLFQAFQQADAGISRKYGGTGLGLAISKQIVNMMHGQFQVKSEPNVGSDFGFTIHVPTEASIMAANASTAIPSNISPSLRVLVAEDNLVNQRLLFMMLQNIYKISAAVAGNGVEALHLAAEQNFDVIFMDVVMPEMDGIEASQRIFEDARTKGKDAPVIIAVTSTISETLAETLKSIGIKALIEKPVTSKQLESAILLAEQEKNSRPAA